MVCERFLMSQTNQGTLSLRYSRSTIKTMFITVLQKLKYMCIVSAWYFLSVNVFVLLYAVRHICCIWYFNDGRLKMFNLLEPVLRNTVSCKRIPDIAYEIRNKNNAFFDMTSLVSYCVTKLVLRSSMLLWLKLYHVLTQVRMTSMYVVRRKSRVIEYITIRRIVTEMHTVMRKMMTRAAVSIEKRMPKRTSCDYT